ncbi:MAG: inverting alpha-L-rhamnosidase, partial [Capsulimonas sp.]|nr:inverting alpha-L-rhamnosidase [Capsulimonas sp.]
EALIEHTDVRPVGSYSCSNIMVNKIHDAMREGMRMFLRSAPLDPDRDERQAWMGDPAKDAESDAYNFDVGAFYTKWMDDVRRSQRTDGSIPDVAMYWTMGNGVEWPSVFTIIPDWYVGFYGDNRLSQRNYEAMKRWVLAMKLQHGQPDGTLEGSGYGDWCDVYSMDGKGSDAGMTSHELISTAYQYNNIRIVQHTAERLGRTDDAAMWRSMGDAMQIAFMAKFFDPKTCKYTSETQCSYVLPLAFGLTPADPALRTKIVENLVHDITVTHDNHLTVGLLGNQWLLQVLSQNGRPDVAWSLVTQTTKPSWGYMINYGSNTIWERWDYDTRDPGMNSEALLIQAGNVDAWFYQTLGGINYDPAKPGFAHILIQPHMAGDLTWVKCQFDSPRGLIVSNWTRNSQNATMNVTIPANTTATVTTPDGAAHEVGAGDWVFKSRVK